MATESAVQGRLHIEVGSIRKICRFLDRDRQQKAPPSRRESEPPYVPASFPVNHHDVDLEAIVRIIVTHKQAWIIVMSGATIALSTALLWHGLDGLLGGHYYSRQMNLSPSERGMPSAVVGARASRASGSRWNKQTAPIVSFLELLWVWSKPRLPCGPSLCAKRSGAQTNTSVMPPAR